MHWALLFDWDLDSQAAFDAVNDHVTLLSQGAASSRNAVDCCYGIAIMPALRLHWWDAPGRAGEPTRLALTLKGLPFEDVRYSFGDMERVEATRAKSPYQQFPILEVDGETLVQSNTILRYVGRLTGLLPDARSTKLEINEIF